VGGLWVDGWVVEVFEAKKEDTLKT